MFIRSWLSSYLYSRGGREGATARGALLPAIVCSVACACDSALCSLSYGILSTSNVSAEVRLPQVMFQAISATVRELTEDEGI
jgi:hypothetical protein